MRPKTYFFLVFLLLLLFFILGVRYGQYVEKKNKVIDYLLSITPTITPTKNEAPSPQVKYSEYKTKRWNLRLVYPDFLKIEESTKEAKIILKF